MTKSKLSNGACSNPLNRLIKRMEEHRRRHLISISNHKSKTKTDIKINTELKNLLERKSKSSDNKTKKKRATNPLSAVNKKKAKQLEMSQKLHSNGNNTNSSNYFCTSLAIPELNPNVTLSMTTGSLVPQNNVILPSVVPELDHDYSMQFNLNESEIDSVLNNDMNNEAANVPYQFIKKEEMTSKPTALVKEAPLFPPPPSTHETHSQDSRTANFPLNYPRNNQLSYNFTANNVDPNPTYYYHQQSSSTSNFPLPTMTGWYATNNSINATSKSAQLSPQFVHKYQHQYPVPNESAVLMNHQFNYSAPQYNPSLNVSLTNNINNNMYFISHPNNDNNNNSANTNLPFQNNFYQSALR